ncbi:MAG: chorismate synthase [Actinomycetota bacterium]|nr:chorismate synthase [Actinomycetota bacterium]
MIRFLTAGESHGPALTAIIEGAPAGLVVDADGLGEELARRRLGHGRGPRMRLERDEIEILGGVRFGRTLGSPISVLIRNTEWERWSEEMSPGDGSSRRVMTSPRPGHADLPGMMKYDTHDARNVLERASARETAARTVAGHVSKMLLAEVGVAVLSHVVQIGSVTATAGVPEPGDLSRIDASPVRCFDEVSERAMVEAVDLAKKDRDTLGGVVEVLAYGVPVGIGSHVHWDRRLDTAIAAGLMSIPGIKGVEIGDGFASAGRPGSVAHDEIHPGDGTYERTTNRAGGIEGGISNGNVIRARAAMKPISTLMRPLATVDVTTGEISVAFRERSDVCAVPAAGVVAEQMMAIAIAREMQRVYGGDTVDAFVDADATHRRRLAQF